MSKTLLRQYVREALGSTLSAPRTGSGNLYANKSGGTPIAQQGGNVLDDEQKDIDAAAQGKMRAACCLIISDDGKVLAVSRKDDPTAFGMPGGKVDRGETPIEAAARELQEETGLIATDLRQVFKRQEQDGYETTTFVCKVTGEINTDESGAVRWVSPQALFDGPFGSYNMRLWKHLGLPE